METWCNRSCLDKTGSPKAELKQLSLKLSNSIEWPQRKEQQGNLNISNLALGGEFERLVGTHASLRSEFTIPVWSKKLQAENLI